jgi:twinkle protein
MLTQRAIRILEERGLDVELAVRLGIESSDRLNGECIAIPYKLNGTVVNHKYRLIDEKQFAQDEGAVKCFWNIDALKDESLSSYPVVICEGELDALSALQADYPRTLSVPDGAPKTAVGDDDRGSKYSYVRDAMDLFRGVNEIILAVDSDGPGINLLNDLAVRFGKYRCKWVRYPKNCKDLNDALRLYGVKGVQETLKRAEWMRVDGVFKMSDLPPVPDFEAYHCGIEGLNENLKIRMCDFTVVTGVPSHGKSAFVNDLCCNLVQHHGLKVAFGSFEQNPQVDHKRNLRRWYAGKMVRDMSPVEKAEADLWIDRNFCFIVPSEDDDADLVWCLERCAVAVVQHGCKVVVVDPWNELDHSKPLDMTTTEYVGYAIKQFKKFARKYQIHLIVVAHPAKMRRGEDGQYPIPSLYDISDSAHWFNKPDLGIVVHRTGEHETMIRVAKSRYHEIIGKPGDVFFGFNTATGRYELTP